MHNTFDKDSKTGNTWNHFRGDDTQDICSNISTLTQIVLTYIYIGSDALAKLG